MGPVVDGRFRRPLPPARPLLRCPPMPRIARRLFTLCSVASLVPCVAVTSLWIRAYFAEDCLAVAERTPDARLRGRSLTNRMGVIAYTDQSFDARHAQLVPESESTALLTVAGVSLYSSEPAPDPTPIVGESDSVAGFRWARYDADPRHDIRGVPTHEVWVPHWLPLLLSGAPPAAWAVATVRGRRRRATGLCARCGYDLRATPRRCPECGTRRAAKKA